MTSVGLSLFNDVILCLFVKVNTETEACTLIGTRINPVKTDCEDKRREVKVKNEERGRKGRG